MVGLDLITPVIIDLKQAELEDPVANREIKYLVACLDSYNVNGNNFVDATETIDLSSEVRREAISMATYGRCEGCTRSWVLAVGMNAPIPQPYTWAGVTPRLPRS